MFLSLWVFEFTMSIICYWFLQRFESFLNKLNTFRIYFENKYLFPVWETWCLQIQLIHSELHCTVSGLSYPSLVSVFTLVVEHVFSYQLGGRL